MHLNSAKEINNIISLYNANLLHSDARIETLIELKGAICQGIETNIFYSYLGMHITSTTNIVGCLYIMNKN